MLSYPNDEYAPLAYFYNADCFFWLQQWDDAANAYQNFYLSFPKHERVPNAMFQKAVCLFRKGSYDDAVADFKDFPGQYPNHPLAKECLAEHRAGLQEGLPSRSRRSSPINM